jgi:hypothetical protein
VVPDGSEAGPDDAALVRSLAAGFARGQVDDALPLVGAGTVWGDEMSGRSSSGKGALRPWTSELGRALAAKGQPAAQVWTAGDWMVAEWAGEGMRRVDFVRLESGHIAEVRSWQEPRRKEKDRR